MTKIKFNSIAFKTTFHILSFSILFILFIAFVVRSIFSNAYMDLENEKINIILNNIKPSLSLSLSYGFEDAIDEISHKALENKNVLLLKIKELNKNNTKVFTNYKLDAAQYLKNEELFQTIELFDPTTKDKLAELTIIYSNDSYKKYMNDFNKYFFWGTLGFLVSIFILIFLLHKSLKNLTLLDISLKNFNPNKPKKLILDTSKKDEVYSISNSANIMIENIINFLNASKELNNKLIQSQSHLKDAQRMAKVGSLEYNLLTKELILSDEYYRILSRSKSTKLSWDDFLNLISRDDYKRVLSVINKAIEEGSTFDVKYSINSNSKIIHIQTKGKVRKKHSGSVSLTAVSMDITQDVKNKQIIEKLAYFDSLTGLANRTLLKDRMTKAIQSVKRTNDKLAIIFLDLDHFKLINDTLGHSVGDDLLVYISNILKGLLRESDTLSRLGGDEFVILLPYIKNDDDANIIASKIQKTLEKKHNIGTHQLYITSSIGVSMYPDHGETCDELIRNADTAMYEAKNQGRNRYTVYSHSMGNFIDKQLHLEQDLAEAVKNKTQIEVFYQAKIDSITNMISGAEALVRWKHPTHGMIFPDDFIYVAESTGLMIELGNIITEESIYQMQRWNELGFKNLKISINLSSRQFQDSSLISFISSMLIKYKVDPAQIEFEITESMSMSNMDSTLRILNDLKILGVSIAIDDFGTGHSSLAYLKKFPIDTLKVDKSFVMEILNNEDDKVIVQTIISMAHSLGMKVVAEGVETLDHVNILKNMDCNLLQGYYYSKAITDKEFINYLSTYKAS